MPRFPSRFHSAALLLSLPLSVLSLAARAENVGVALPDLTYLPGEGRFVSDTTLSYQRSSHADYQPNDVVVIIPPFGYPPAAPNPIYLADKYRQNTYSETEGLRYGVIDGLVIGISETCSEVEQRTHEEESYFFDVTVGGYSGGCDNPTVSATYRLLGQSAFPVNVDVYATYAPDLVRGDLGRPFAAPGGQRGDVGVTVSRAFEEISLLGRVGTEWAGKAKQTDSTGDSQSSDAFARPYAELLAQYKPDGAFFLTAGFRAYAGYDGTTRSLYNLFGDTFSGGGAQ